MNTVWEQLRSQWQTPAGRLEWVANGIVLLCVAAIFLSIAIDFAEYHRRPPSRRQRSVVATGSMTAFFLLYYALIKLRIGALALPLNGLRMTLVVVGLLAIVLGCAVNLAGRFHLGSNWANHVTIYPDQRLVTSGVYAWVRHPLYASLIWMFYGGCLVYANYAALLANALVFVPFMTYRARQEEALLREVFPEYAAYAARTGRFFPKLCCRTRSL